MNTGHRDRERAALEVLRSTGVDVLESALVARAALGRGRARGCVRVGAREMTLEERENKERRARMVTDFRCYCKRLMARNPGLAERRVRSNTPDDCRAYLQEAYSGSSSQYRKARAIMCGVFPTAVKHDWCDANPVARVKCQRWWKNR